MFRNRGMVVGAALACLLATLPRAVAGGESAAQRGFEALVPGRAALVLGAPSVEALKKRASSLEKKLPGVMPGASQQIEQMLPMVLERFEPVQGLDLTRPIGAAMTLEGAWYFFLPASEPEALSRWLGEGSPVQVVGDYVVMARGGVYEKPERSRFRFGARGDLLVAVRPSALLRQYASMVDMFVGMMRQQLSAQPEMATVMPIVEAEVEIFKAIIESTQQFDLGMGLRGGHLVFDMRVVPTRKSGLVRKLIEAQRSASAAARPALGGLLAPGAPIELDGYVAPEVLNVFFDAVPWDRLSRSADVKSSIESWKTMMDEMLELMDGRIAISYDIGFSEEGIALDVQEVFGLTDGPGFRRLMREMPKRPEFDQMKKAFSSIIPDLELSIEPDAMEVEGVTVDRIEESFRIAVPTPPGGPVGPQAMEFAGYLAVVGDVGMMVLGENAKEGIARLIRQHKKGASHENLLSSMSSSRGFLRGVVDTGAFVNMVGASLPAELASSFPTMPTGDPKLFVTIEKRLVRSGVQARVRVPIVPLIRIFASEGAVGSKPDAPPPPPPPAAEF